jgi:hypothetical protein
MKTIKQFLLVSLCGLMFVSCGNKSDDDDGTKVVKRKFELSQLQEAGLYLSKASNTFSDEIYIACDEDQVATASTRKALLLELHDWVEGTEGSLSLDGQSISEYAVQRLAQSAYEKFDGMEDDDSTCPSVVLSISTI